MSEDFKPTIDDALSDAEFVAKHPYAKACKYVGIDANVLGLLSEMQDSDIAFVVRMLAARFTDGEAVDDGRLDGMSKPARRIFGIIENAAGSMVDSAYLRQYVGYLSQQRKTGKR